MEKRDAFQDFFQACPRTFHCFLWLVFIGVYNSDVISWDKEAVGRETLGSANDVEAANMETLGSANDVDGVPMEPSDPQHSQLPPSPSSKQR